MCCDYNYNIMQLNQNVKLFVFSVGGFQWKYDSSLWYVLKVKTLIKINPYVATWCFLCCLPNSVGRKWKLDFVSIEGTSKNALNFLIFSTNILFVASMLVCSFF